MSELRALARGVPGAEWRRIIEVRAPGAGVDLSVPVQPLHAWRLLSVSCAFTAAAVAGNRAVTLSALDAGGKVLWQVPAPTVITSAQAATLSWSAGLGATAPGVGLSWALPLPDPWYMMPGETLAIVGHTNAGDTITNARVVVIETPIGETIHDRNILESFEDHIDALRR